MPNRSFIKYFILIFYISSVFSTGSLAQTEKVNNFNYSLYSPAWKNSHSINLYPLENISLPDYNWSNTSFLLSSSEYRIKNYKYHYSNLKEDASEDHTSIEAPYVVNLIHNGSFTGTGLALYGASAYIKSNQQPLSKENIGDLDLNRVWELDRGATRFSSANAHQASNFFLYSSMVTPFLYLTKEKSRKNFDAIILMQAETLLLTNAITCLTKTIVNRPRPYAYNASFPLDDKLDFNSKESFFSGHVAATASMSFFTATTFSQYYPDSKLKPLVWSYAVIWPAATGYFRYTAGKHFPTDIITGYLVGAMTGILIPKIHQKIAKKKEQKRLPFN